ncbi:MAG: T9SS type A sorting domain-containing protein, partial [Bacteroidota bacterium]
EDTEVLYQDWGAGEGDVEFFSLSNMSFDDNSDVTDYKDRHNLSYPGAGQDGGSLTAVQPYVNDEFGPFFGTPTFVVIAPDGTVQFDVAGGSNAATIAALDAAIEATGAVKPSNEVFYQIGGQILSITGQAVAEAAIDLEGGIAPVMSNAGGNYSIGGIPASSTINIAPEKDVNHDNGISAFDIVLASRHILGIEQLDSPYKEIAADVNLSGKITTFDLIQLRKLILLIDTVFTDVPSWRFVPSSHVFSDDPLMEAFPEHIAIGSLEQDRNDLDFVGIKMGDVNGSANGQELLASEDRSASPFWLEVEELDLVAGQDYQVAIRCQDEEELVALQMSLSFDPSAIALADQAIQTQSSLLAIDAGNFGHRYQSRGVLTFSWNDWENKPIPNQGLLFEISFKALQSGPLSQWLQLNSAYTPGKAFQLRGLEREVALNFASPPLMNTTASPFHLFPNPAHSSATLQLDSPVEENYSLHIYDAQQKRVFTKRFVANKQHRIQEQIDLSGWAPGVYFIQVQSADGTLHYRDKLLVF